MGAKNFFKLFKKDYFLSIISMTISVLIFSFGTLKDCSQQQKFDEISYKNLALSYRPEVVVVRPPEIVKVTLCLDTTKEGRAIMSKSIRDTNSIDIIIPTTTTLDFQLSVTNNNNNRAIVLAYVLADTANFYPMLDTDLDKRELNIDCSEDIYKSAFLIQNDTLHYNLSYKIQNLKEDIFILHFLVFYENEADILYNTYYQAKYRIKFPTIYVPGEKPKNITYSDLKLYGSQKMLEFIEDNISSYFYTEKKAQLIKDFFDKKIDIIKKLTKK